ncbi:MAG TPA: tetratricopeptide repeat protein [Actinomycetota bacterium]|nr:tetratricopeptide repeat protein [Actinomycetota bacterium]
MSRSARKAFERAREHCAKGADLLDRGELDAAEREYVAATELIPEMRPAWFDLGLIAKRRRDWDRMFDYNARAASLPSESGEEDPAWWNLGIAATALGRWDEARNAWRRYGLEIPDGEGPIDASFGMAPVRLDPGGAGEVVWCDRLDPCRAVIKNVPLPESGHRWTDVVLHDGAPNGERTWEGRTFPVFDELERVADSGIPTLSATVESQDGSAIGELLQACIDQGLGAEDWATSVRIICTTCSEGSVDQRPDHEHEEVESHSVGFAGEEAAVSSTLETWVARNPDTRSFSDLVVAL